MRRWGHGRWWTLPAAALLAGSAAGTAACGPVPTAAPTASITSTASTSPATDREQISALLDTRAAAVVATDRAAFRATADPAPAVQVAQDRLFTRFSSLRWESWAYTVERTTVLPMRTAGEVRARAEAVVRSTLAGVGDGGASTRMVLELARSEGRWRVLSERAESPALWDSDAVVAERFDDGLVIGVGGVPSDELRDLGRLQQQAVHEAAAALGVRAPEGWVLIVPADSGLMTSLLGRERGAVDRIAAITMPAGLSSQSGGQSGGDRVWINRRVFAGLDQAGQLIVLRHEAVHLLTGAGRSAAVPMWLEEGLAEYIGYLGSGVPLRDAARQLLGRGRVPRSLPTDSRFDGADPRVTLAYNEALTAAVWLADRLGTAGLVALYRTVSVQPAAEADARDAPGSVSAQQLDRHLRAHGLTVHDLVSGWRHAVATWTRDGSRRL